MTVMVQTSSAFPQPRSLLPLPQSVKSVPASPPWLGPSVSQKGSFCSSFSETRMECHPFQVGSQTFAEPSPSTEDL